METLLLGAELFRANGRTDRQTERRDKTKLKVAFSNSAKEPNNCMISSQITANK